MIASACWRSAVATLSWISSSLTCSAASSTARSAQRRRRSLIAPAERQHVAARRRRPARRSSRRRALGDDAARSRVAASRASSDECAHQPAAAPRSRQQRSTPTTPDVRACACIGATQRCRAAAARHQPMQRCSMQIRPSRQTLASLGRTLRRPASPDAARTPLSAQSFRSTPAMSCVASSSFGLSFSALA